MHLNVFGKKRHAFREEMAPDPCRGSVVDYAVDVDVSVLGELVMLELDRSGCTSDRDGLMVRVVSVVMAVGR